MYNCIIPGQATKRFSTEEAACREVEAHARACGDWIYRTPPGIAGTIVFFKNETFISYAWIEKAE